MSFLIWFCFQFIILLKAMLLVSPVDLKKFLVIFSVALIHGFTISVPVLILLILW